MSYIEFFVPGDPQPQGSKRAFYNQALGRALVVEANSKLKPWRSVTTCKAQEAMSGQPILDGPIKVDCSFIFLRPKGHYGSGKNSGCVKDSAPKFKTSKPDLDKLIRGVLDAITGVVFKDDSQVCQTFSEKRYSPNSPGCWVRIFTI